jgi:hypothetical protein
MEKTNNIKKEKHSNFFNLIKKEDLDDSSFVDWLDELQKDLSYFWEKMNN